MSAVHKMHKWKTAHMLTVHIFLSKANPPHIYSGSMPRLLLSPNAHKGWRWTEWIHYEGAQEGQMLRVGAGRLIKSLRKLTCGGGGGGITHGPGTAVLLHPAANLLPPPHNPYNPQRPLLHHKGEKTWHRALPPALELRKPNNKTHSDIREKHKRVVFYVCRPKALLLQPAEEAAWRFCQNLSTV